MRTIHWLHFSDLHLNDTGVETSRLRRLLPSYLRSLNLHCDYSFFTGDIRRAKLGDFPENSADAILQISNAVNIGPDRIFIVPGNHDLYRDSPGRQASVEKIWCRATESGYYDFNTGRIAEEDIAVIADGQSGFRNVLQGLYQDTARVANYERPCFCITTDDMNIVHLDSTITQGSGQDRDFVIGTELLQNVLSRTDQTKPTVLLTHYSFDFLHRNEQKVLMPMLQEYGVQMWIAGHEHDHLCRKHDWFYEFQTGNLVLENGATSCVLIGSLDLDTGTGLVQCHAYFPHGGWAVYPFIRTGAEDNSIYPFAIRLPGGRNPLDASLEEIRASEAYTAMEEAGGLFHDVTVNPDLIPDLQWNGQLFQNAEGCGSLLYAVDALWTQKMQAAGSCHALLLGDGGMGKSTMLFHAGKTLLHQHRLAVYASLQMLQRAGRSLLDHILYILYRTEDDAARNQLMRLLEHSGTCASLIVLVDGFNELNGDRAYQYADELKDLCRYAGIQIIVSSRLDFLRNYGMAHFQMLRTCDLRDEQIAAIFPQAQWQDILSKPHLHILLKNPMMALLYAATIPIIKKYRDLPFCDWRLPITSSTDLLHDYYHAQIALTLEREGNGYDIFCSLCAVEYVLPYLAHKAERINRMGWDDMRFETVFSEAIRAGTARVFEGDLPPAIQQIRRQYQLRIEAPLSDGDVYGKLINRLCLLRRHDNMLSFPHQIHRDYLAAVHLSHELASQDVPACWKDRPIQTGVAQYLRHMRSGLWGGEGFAAKRLTPYRGIEVPDKDYFVQNILNCWLSEESELDVERDLSDLDLRRIPLSTHLKKQYCGTINIDGAKVTKQTFVNEQRHDGIIGLAFSHDGRMLAAISGNGLVSVSNIATQSQMIVGKMSLRKDTKIGYSADDCLILKTGDRLFKWPTISYDKIEDIDKDERWSPEAARAADDPAQKLYELLDDSQMLGQRSAISDDRALLAVGYSSGHLQVWDTETQHTIAELSLGDSQVVSAAFSPYGDIAALASGGQLVQLWDMRAKKCLRNLRFDKPVRHVRFPATSNFDREPFLECETSDGAYYRINLHTWEHKLHTRPQQLLAVQKTIRGRLKGLHIQKLDIADNGNAIVMLKKSRDVYVWNQETRALNACKGHTSPVIDAAVCKAYPKYAASYSNEPFVSQNRSTRYLDGQKVIHAWAIRKGNCMQHLKTNQRSIEKLRFFSTNRVILAGFATNGDILLWELHNRMVGGEEHGHWHPIDTVRNSPGNPLECAISTRDQTLIGAYSNGTLFTRKFSGGTVNQFKVFPGIDPTPLRWTHLKGDAETIDVLSRYKKQ